MVAWPFTPPLSACCLPSGYRQARQHRTGSFRRRQPHACTFVVQRRRTGPPRFLGNPCMDMPCSSTPAALPCQAHTAGSCCLPAFENCRRLPLPQFRGSITRPIHSLCTLRSGGYPTPRNTRCRLVASLGRVGLSPTGFHDILSTFSVSRMSRLCLAHSNPVYGRSGGSPV